MDTSEYFVKLNLKSSLFEIFDNKIKNSSDSDWKELFDLSIYNLNRDIFHSETKILSLIDYFGCQNKISLFRFMPNSSYSWHYDGPRNVALNMQISGDDSFCLFGKMDPLNSRKFSNVAKLEYENYHYYLLNVSEYHSVLNFNNIRYVLSIGFPKPITFNDVKNYIMQNNLD